jgi:5'-nucleotidase
MRRRHFLRTAGAAAAGGLLLPEWLRASEATRIVILHTNDTHSRMDPFPMDGGRFEGLGGAARRATLVRRVRDQNPNVLLLDSGDIFQGTPYFNFFKGEIEYRAMSEMGYDVTTIGNHDFDNGVEGMVEMMPHADFQFVSANYDVSESPLARHVRPWIIREVGGIRVGIFGLGIAFDGLVLEQLHEGVRYTDPYLAARRCVSELRAQGCSLVICLSHLGYRYRGTTPSDTNLAQEVEGIDLILGGHTHTFMDQPDVYTQPDGRQTLVNQVGWAGMRLGRVDVALEPDPGPRSASSAQSPPQKAWSWKSYPVDQELD